MRRRHDVVWRSAPGFLVLAHDDGRVVTVSGPGADLWEALEAPAELADVVDDLARRYAAPIAEVQRDLAALVDSLAEQGFVERG